MKSNVERDEAGEAKQASGLCRKLLCTPKCCAAESSFEPNLCTIFPVITLSRSHDNCTEISVKHFVVQLLNPAPSS
jgi:hypothetical protein